MAVWGAPRPSSPTRVLSAREIMGEIDAVKLRSSMTLFARGVPEQPVFRQVLKRYSAGAADPAGWIDGGDP